MTLSVIIPAYNSEKTIIKCINSIQNQDYKDLEIIVVDDGSSDDTVKLIYNMMKTDKRIVLLSQKNKGAALARKRGILNASGTYIGFVDSDDWIESEMYSGMMSKAIETDADVVFCKMSFDYINRIDIQRQLIKDGTILSGDQALHVLHNRIGVEGGLFNKIYKKDLFCNIRYPNKPVIQEDYVIVKQLLEKAKTVVCHDKLGYHYIQNSGSSALNGYNDLWERGYYNYKRMLLEAQKSNDKIYIKDIENYMVNNFMWMILVMGENNTFDKEKIRWIKKYLRKRVFSILYNKYNTLLCKVSVISMIIDYRIVLLVYRLYRKLLYVRF